MYKRQEQPWEEDFGKPDRIVTALDIMTEGPLGGDVYKRQGVYHELKILKPQFFLRLLL